MIAQLLAGVGSLILFPGGLAAAVAGLGAESLAAWALGGGRPGVAARSVLSALRLGVPRPPVAAGAAALLAMLAATQVAVPFNPLPPADRNAVVAAIALLAATWLAWAAGWGRERTRPGLALLVQAGWLLAVLLPAVQPENLRPQVLGAIAVPGLLPLKLACAGLNLGCLPALLQLLPETAPQGIPTERLRRRREDAAFTGVRALLWLPACGLFVSLFVPPAGADPLGVVRFAAVAALAALVTIGLAAYLDRRPGAAERIYRRLGIPYALFTIAVGVLTAVLD